MAVRSTAPRWHSSAPVSVLPGAAKLAPTRITRNNFARWGYSDSVRFAIGAIEVGVAGVAHNYVPPGLLAAAAVPVLARDTFPQIKGRNEH